MPLNDAQFLALVKSLAQELPSAFPSRCRSAIEELSEKGTERGKDLPPDLCKAVLTFVCSVASPRVAAQPELQFPCLELLGRAGLAVRAYEEDASKADVQAFFFKLLKKEAKTQPAFKPRVMVFLLQYLLRWLQSSNALKSLSKEGAFKPEVITSLLEALASEMGKCLRWQQKWQLKATRALRKVLATTREVAMPWALAYLKKSEDPPALLVAAVTTSEGVDRAALVELYTKHVLEAKKPLAEFSLAAWGPAVTAASAEEFEKQLLPTAMRMMKRQPAASATSFPAMVSSAKLDLSSQAKELLELAPEKLKDKEKRLAGRQLVRDVVAKSADLTALVAVAESWAELAKKAGKIDEKQATLQALAELASNLPKMEEATVAKLIDAKGPLIKVAAEDANEETRFLAYTALGALAVLLPSSAQDQVVAELLKPLADKKAPERARLAALTAMAQVAQQSEGTSRTWAGSFVEKALPLLTLASTKPAQRMQSLLAWATVGSLAKADPEALSSKLKKDQLTLLKESVSFLNALPIIQKAPLAELSAQAQFWRALLAGLIPGSPSLADAAKEVSWLALPKKPFGETLPIVRSTIVLLAGLHSSSPERGLRTESEANRPSKAMSLTTIIQQLKDEDANNILLLLAEAFIAWLAEMAALPKPQRQVNSSALRDILVDLCHAAATASGPLRPEIVCLLSLAAHHPLLGSRHWPQLKHWRWLRYRGPLAACFEKGRSDVWATLRELILAGRAIPGTDASGCRRAAISLASAFEGDEPALHEEAAALVRECVAALPTEQVSAEALEDVKIFFAPEGVLWIEEGVYVAEERENKNLTKNKYLQGFEEEETKQGPSATRLKFAPKDRDKPKESKAKDGKDTKPGKGKSKGAAASEKGAMTQGQIEEARIQEQSETRARIRRYVDEACFGMDVMVSLARNESSKQAFEELLPELVPNFLKLLQSPLTVLQTRRCLRSLVSLVVPRQSIARRDLLPDALMVVGKRWLARSPASAGTPGKERVCEVVLDGVDSVRKLDSCSMALIFPIIIRALYDGGSLLQVLCTRALHLLEHQLALGLEVSEETANEVFDSLSVVLLALPGMAHSTQATMAAACKHMVASTETLGKLAQMFFSDEELMRESVITALGVLPENLHVQEGDVDADAARAVLRLGALDKDCAETAKKTLDELQLEADEVLMMELIDFAREQGSVGRDIQELIAKALAEVLQELDDPKFTDTALDLLMQLFREQAAPRITIARCLERMYATNLQGVDQVNVAFEFILRQGLGLTNGSTTEASELRDVLLAAGITLIEQHGEECAEDLYKTVESFEDSAGAKAAGESASLGIAVFLGALSKHLGKDNPKVEETIPRLLARLLDKSSTPSVQDAIVKVMPPLMKANKEQAAEALEQLLETALAPKTDPVTRRGAAMGLGATVKGLSIQAVSQYQVLKRIEDVAEDKKSAAVREGAVLCLEGLAVNLGRLFDPYTVMSLPMLQRAFSDSQQTVRKASQVAANAMMSQISGPGVKQVLKPLLAPIEDRNSPWRTKLGSIELLASMTSCARERLGACLPQVVPALCNVINDEHAKVKEAAREAFNKIANIIKSPELRAIAPELISALTDGAQYEHITRDVLDKLLGTSFATHVDAPSLSLVCPVIQRALKERSAEMKRKGAQIVGSMVMLIKDPKDIQPYLPLLLPQLKLTLVDPIPDVRATSAKAFGILAQVLPEDMLGDVMPWLFEMLKSPESNVERTGAAHGLSEVLMAKGPERVQELLPDILLNASDKDAEPLAREGYLGLFEYLPPAMGSSFEPYLEEVLTTLLDGMSDDTASVRDTALKAAQVIIRHFGSSHTALLLPPLEEGVFVVDWRVRHGAIQLMGQLIQQILRAHRIPTNSAELMQVEALPKEWRCHMLASLYIVRSDENVMVKQACQQVWKAVVQNPPRTLKELLPTLMTRLIANLASTNRERQRVAARCVGDLVGKLGERVMPELMPIFMETLSEGDTHVREGVCLGLAELINATTKELLTTYLEQLIPAIQQALIDDDEAVRLQASTVVALLHSAVGARATNEIVEWLLDQLMEEVVEEGDLFVLGLEQLMKKQPGAVKDLVLSRLTSPGEDGWTRLQVQGLASLAVVPDSHTVHTHLSDVMPVFIKVASIEDEDQPEMQEIAIESATRVMDAVQQDGLTLLMTELQGPMQDKKKASHRRVAAQLLKHVFENTSLEVVSVLSLILPALLPSALADEDDEALATSMAALNAITKKCKKEELAPYLNDVRSAVLSLITDSQTKKEDPDIFLPGLCDHKGLEPLYPIYQHGLMYGTAEARELAAKGLGELVNHTTEKALAPYAVKITGPLIRIVGDKFPGNVKKAIVDTLQALLIRGGETLKPFLPQLQTTYVKCLTDPPNSEAVRRKAAESLGLLARRAARTEPLINELSAFPGNSDPAARVALVVALGEVLLNVKQSPSAAVQEKALNAVVSRGSTADAAADERQACGWALGILLRRHMPAEEAVEAFNEKVSPAVTEKGPQRSFAAFALAGICWIQQPNLAEPADESLMKPADNVSVSCLPQLLKDKDAEVQAAGLALAASLAKLHAQSSGSLSFDPLKAAAERIAVLVGSGDAAVPGRLPVLAARHFLAACTLEAKGVSVSVAAAQVAAAVAQRSAAWEDAEDGERALAAALPAESRNEEGAKAALEKLAGCLDGKASQALKTFGAARIRSLSFFTGCSDFAWDL
ncbi:ILA [Symbiodinium sp. CCMP2592]|nr:ILA [Symbiodinium sp. CCMP2592]